MISAPTAHSPTVIHPASRRRGVLRHIPAISRCRLAKIHIPRHMHHSSTTRRELECPLVRHRCIAAQRLRRTVIGGVAVETARHRQVTQLCRKQRVQPRGRHPYNHIAPVRHSRKGDTRRIISSCRHRRGLRTVVLALNPKAYQQSHYSEKNTLIIFHLYTLIIIRNFCFYIYKDVQTRQDITSEKHF